MIKIYRLYTDKKFNIVYIYITKYSGGLHVIYLYLYKAA